MSHLTPETLARLVDEPPDPDERAHLTACPRCAREMEALAEQRALLASLPDLVPPPDAWPRLRAQLRREGLLQRRPLASSARLRAAAAACLFLAGGIMGYLVRGPGEPALPPQAAMTMEDPRSGATAMSPPAEPGLEVEEAGERFMAALDRYMATAGAGPADPAARLAALDNIVLTTAEALAEAPTDPVINGYHLSALAQRNAVIRQLATGAGDPIF